MSLSDILNLSNPRVVAIGVIAAVGVVGFALQSVRYDPVPVDSCAGMPIAPAMAEDTFEYVAEMYLQRTRNWSRADYCVDKQSDQGGEHIVSVFRRGKLVGGGEGFRLRIDPKAMAVKGELPHE